MLHLNPVPSALILQQSMTPIRFGSLYALIALRVLLDARLPSTRCAWGAVSITMLLCTAALCSLLGLILCCTPSCDP